MTGISDFLTESQKAVDSMLNHPLHRLRNDLQAVVQAQQGFQENILASAKSVSMAVETTQMMFAREYGAVQTLAQKLASDFEGTQKWAQQLASEFEATQEWAREREALPASVSEPVVFISPRPDVRMPSPDIEPLSDIEPVSERTIVRPEVKRKIGF